jgi:hypothetical protein
MKLRCGAEVMGAVRLWLTEECDEQKAAALASVLRSYVRIDGPHFVVRRSAQGLEQYIQLLGSWETWVAAFGVFGAAFLAKLGQRTADAFWDSVRGHLKSAEARALAEVSEALSAASQASGTPTKIIVGLDIPDRYFGTALVIDGVEPEEIAYALAQFAVVAERISTLMNEEIEAGSGPFGRAVITFSEDGAAQVQWITRDYKRRQIYLPSARWPTT